MDDFIYVGQLENDGEFTIECAFFTEDSAREWMRKAFLDMKADTHIPDEDWDWFENSSDDPELGFYHMWGCASLNNPYGIRLFRFPASAGDAHQIYVCQVSESEKYPVPVALCFSEDEAREWIRRSFVSYRDENRLENSRFCWDSSDGWWGYCGDEGEQMDWEVFRLPLPE